VLEFIFGNAAWEFATLMRLVKSGQVSRRAVLLALPWRALPLVVTAMLTWLLGGTKALVLYPGVTLAVLWVSSQAARHLQWVEHLGVLAEGTMQERSLHTRNLTNKTPFGWLFNRLTLQEAWNHAYHHIEPGRPLSSIDGLAPEPRHVVIDGRQYSKVLRDYWRSLN